MAPNLIPTVGQTSLNDNKKPPDRVVFYYSSNLPGTIPRLDLSPGR